MRFVRRSPFVLAVVALLSISLFALVNGNIHGHVTDASGAAIPGATVKIVNTETGYTRTLTTDVHGMYQALAMPVGTYDVTVSKTGFTSFTAKSVILTVGASYAVNAKLRVGEVSQTVEVNASALQVNTTNAELGTVINAQQIVSLPLVGRNWVQLQLLQPGVVSSSDRFGTYSTNGNRTQANDYIVDGIDYNDAPLNTPQAPPSPDSLTEFRMVSSVMDAQYGHNSGAVISAVTKSGTNQFHGDLFEFYRDTSLDSADFFTNAVPRVNPAVAPKPAPFHQNEFGGTFGGPIVHNKTFFFFSYQGYRNKTGSATTTTVFTPAERAGNWAGTQFSTNVSPRPLWGDSASGCAVGSANPCPAGTPYTKLFSTGMIPSQDFDPLAVKLMQTYVPLPNAVGGNYTFSTANTRTDDQYIYRLDQYLGSSDRLAFIGQWERSPTETTLPFTGANLPGWAEIDGRHDQRYDLEETHSFSPTVLNQFRLGYTRFNFGAVNPASPASPDSFGFSNIIAQNSVGSSMPLVGVTGYFTLGFSTNGPQPRIDATYELGDNFSWIDGSQTFKFGEDIRRAEVYNPFSAQNNGDFGFGGGGAFSTGAPGVDYLLGIPDSYGQGSGDVIDARNWSTYLYFEDKWQVTPTLDITLGTGYQLSTPFGNDYYGGLGVTGWRAGEQSTVFPTAPLGVVYPGDPNMPVAGMYTHYKDFAPVGAFAWEFKPKWSLRGGFGLFYNATEEETTLETLGSPPFGTTASVNSPLFSNPLQYYTSAGVKTGTQQFPYTPPKAGATPNFVNLEPLFLNVMDPKNNIPYNENFNLTLQHQLGNAALATFSYAGSYGRHLEGVIPVNPYIASQCEAMAGCNPGTEVTYPVGSVAPQINPNNGLMAIPAIGEESDFLNSTYNSFQAELRKSFSHGLMFNISYTWMHATDQGSSFEGAWGGIDPSNLMYSYGNSDYDQPQRLVIGYVYDIPGTRFAHLLTNGWELAGITTFQSGLPYSVFNTFARNLNCQSGWSFYGCWDRPNQVTRGLTFYTNPRFSPNNALFEPGAFAPQAIGTNGDSGRNSWHGPGLSDYDFSLYRNVQVSESKSFQFRFEFYNLFNHTNFANPNTTVGTPSFGQITGTQGNPRLIQLALKLYF
ncbi:MAG: carboxypeptidase regulatory-like domain-containing protein [Terriglobales bacterium]